MTPLNFALKGNPQAIGCDKSLEVHESLDDWLQLINSLATQPASVHEIISVANGYYGYCDVLNTGSG